MASTDPTKTLTVRREFSGEAYSRLRRVRGLVRESLVDRDALRVNQPDFGQPAPDVPSGTATPARVQHFMDWLQRIMNTGVLGTSNRDAVPRLDQHWAGQYVRRAYAQGVQRARQQVGDRNRQDDGATGETAAVAGGVAALLVLPAHRDALDLQWDRTWNALRAAVEQGEHVARQRLIDGLARGDAGRDLAAAINDDALDRVATRRARLIARTEVVRAHAEAQLNEFRRQGVQEVGAEVEFRSMRDDRVCSICRELDGVTFSVDDAHGIIPVHPNPMSLDTEVYTRRGWVPVGQVTRDDDALSLEPGTFDLGWQPVVDTVHRVADRMVWFHNSGFDSYVSCDHNMFVRTKRGDGTQTGWRSVEAEQVPLHSQFYRSSEWVGSADDTVTVAGIVLPIETFCEFMGWWLSEGSFSRTSIVIHQSQRANPDNYDRIVETCRQIAPTGRVAEYAARDRVSFSLPGLRAWLDQFGKSHQKWIPREVLDARPSAIRVFLDAYARGDGHVGQSTEQNHPKIIYSTSSRRMADQLGEALLKVGRQPSYDFTSRAGTQTEHRNGVYCSNHDVWIVRECYRKTASVQPTGVQKDVLETGGTPVACVSLPRWHTIFTRRNGRCCWVMNCRCIWLPALR